MSLPRLLLILLLPCTVWASEALDLEGDFTQGGLLRGRTLPGTQVRFLDREVRVDAEGRFILGLGRDAPEEMTVTATLPGGEAVSESFRVARRDYDIQRIDGLPEKQVTPPEEVLARIRKETAQVKQARATDSAERLFDAGFIWPVEGPISGVYGSQRILNGEPRQPHYGVDIARDEGTPFVAPADGVVILAEPDLYFSGGTLMLDHGQGLMSAFLHLSRIDVTLGQRVKQGETLGAIGRTGRVTGPHLDWRVNWFEERLDAQRLVPPMPQSTN